ncbi:hypothetical protein Tco_0085359 [Tanacetum coccineum]
MAPSWDLGTISPRLNQVKYPPNHFTYFSGMTSGREMTPPPGFSTPPHISNINTNERTPVTTTVFAATTPGNMPFAYRASTSTDPNPMINLAFVEANYEILESLLKRLTKADTQ